MSSGRLYVLEGPERVGKSAQKALLMLRLREQGVDVHGAAEPTYGPIGTLVRQFLRHQVLDDAGQPITDADTIGLLHAADLKPRLRRGQTIVLERFAAVSNLVARASVEPVYQCGVCSHVFDRRDMKVVTFGILAGHDACPECGNSFSDHLPPRDPHSMLAHIAWVRNTTPDGLLPTTVFVLGLSDAERLRRTPTKDRVELDATGRVRERSEHLYRQLARFLPAWDIQHVDASGPAEAVAEAIWAGVLAGHAAEAG